MLDASDAASPPTDLLPYLPQDCLDGLNRCRSAIERRGTRSEIAEHYAPSSALRIALTRHADTLRQALRPAGIEETASIVAWLFRCFPDFSGGGEGALFDIEVYATPLSRYPLFALQYVRAKVENSRSSYRPSLPVLKGWAEDAKRPIEDELWNIVEVLGATVITPALATRERPLLLQWRRMQAGIAQAEARRANRGDLTPPSMLERLAGDRTIPLRSFLSAPTTPGPSSDGQ